MSREPTRILIADDDPESLELLGSALGSLDREIVLARDGGELLDRIADDGPFDLIVTDLNMPWMEGSQVLASARVAGLETPVVIVTGMSQPELQEKIGRLGDVRLFRKPVDIIELRLAVTELLEGTS
jgi:CheY-like chemotaxis protein